jgi:hypothetical protein
MLGSFNKVFLGINMMNANCIFLFSFDVVFIFIYFFCIKSNY